MDSGEIYLEGEKVTSRNPRYMQSKGVALVPESRKTEGLLLNNTISFNITLPVLNRFINFFRVNANKEDEIVDHGIESLRLRHPPPE